MQIFLLWQKYQFWNKECYFLDSIKKIFVVTKMIAFLSKLTLQWALILLMLLNYFRSFFCVESKVTVVG